MRPTVKATQRAIVAAIATAMLALAPATAAQAHASDILLSTDGTTYTATLDGSLFPASARIIPRGVQHATLYVKNPTSHAAILAIHVIDVALSRPDAAGALSLQAASAGTKAAPPVSLGAKNTCAPLLTGLGLSSGASTRVDFTLAMADLPGVKAQNATAKVTLLVSLADAAGPRSATDHSAPAMASGCVNAGVDVPVFTATETTGTHTSNLSHTGSDIIPALALMSTLLGIGGYLLFASRRRQEES